MPAVTMPPVVVKKSKMEQRSSVVFVGRNVPIKNIDATIKIMSRLSKVMPQFRYRILGDGFSGRNMPRSVEIMGAVAQEDVFRHLEDSRMMVFLSYELAGTVALEAVAYGCPVFCLAGYGADFLLSPSESFRVSASAAGVIDHRETASRLCSIISDDQLLERELEKQRTYSSRWNHQSKSLLIKKTFSRMIGDENN